MFLYFSSKYSRPSQSDKADTPTNRLREPPRSAIKDAVEKAQVSVSILMSVEAKL